mmetsp:Transcript_79921/g.226049  ORF Transcript_79921/g.226049 Transcript_79921/m.226049 type:complete len:537 (-) Transcript_79921:121-1731(-)|eukprot:CAMPEP_0168404124 /NCGR_PEP_ID=MMETSP0228-20121227/24479_1 /TAXON_ID=133427 /ORGANISM="Protoceratium reticulatum, Strain CCCM 535 (=CCMP 1889)" /LENGTH=536 /DNA_ID=CAMNT_0008417741 /DNA_START=43 /DNA_END=1653 /DNA_ORIENTATION=-
MAACASVFAALAGLAVARADPTSADRCFENFMGPMADHHAEVTDRKLEIEGALPAWLVGDYYVAGPHYLQVGRTKMDHYLDGLGKLHRFSFRGAPASATWTSRAIQSELFKKSKTLGYLGPCVQFKETVPSRNFSSFKNVFSVNDNNYVVQLPIGDKFLGLTDDASNSLYDEDFHFRLISWHDKLVPSLHQAGTVAHAIHDHATGDITGLMSISPELPFQSLYFLLYKIEPSDPATRKELVRVPVSSPAYQHSFGLSKRHAVVCEHSWVIDGAALLFHGKLAMDASKIDPKAPTKLHLVDLETGDVRVFSADPFLCIHFSNVFETETGVVFDMPTWESHPDTSGGVCNPYTAFDFQVWERRDQFNAKCMNRLVRHVLHTAGPQTGQATSEVMDGGWFEYPVFNQNFRGQRTCFIYLTEFYHNSTTFGAMAVVKYDSCTKQRVAVWRGRAQYPSEPHFVADPSGTLEDDGVILTPIMDGAHPERHAHFAVLSAKDLSLLAKMPLGDTMPHSVHGWFKFQHERKGSDGLGTTSSVVVV